MDGVGRLAIRANLGYNCGSCGLGELRLLVFGVFYLFGSYQVWVFMGAWGG